MTLNCSKLGPVHMGLITGEHAHVDEKMTET